MNLDFSEYQTMIKTQARDFLERECPKSLVREMEVSEDGYSRELWRKMAELGWLGMAFPEKYGGSGGEFMDVAILIEEMGRSLLPGPFLSSVVLGGLGILDAGSDRQREKFIPLIAGGDVTIAMALTEPAASYMASGITTRAMHTNSMYSIEGSKLFVGYANVCDYLLTIAMTGEAESPENGLTAFLVPVKLPGIRCNVIPTIALDKQCEVVFQGTEVSQEDVLGDVGGGWRVIEKAMLRGAAAKCAEMVGGAEAVLEMATSYAKDRVQYGRPIGSFQVIQHYLANMWIDVETARSISYEAIWKVSQGLPCKREVASAKGWVSQVYNRVTERGIQIHGTIGLTRDHDVSLYYRRAKAAELAFGDLNYQREMIAQEIGL